MKVADDKYNYLINLKLTNIFMIEFIICPLSGQRAMVVNKINVDNNNNNNN